MQGRLIKHLLKNTNTHQGDYCLKVDLSAEGERLIPGVYFIRFTSDREVITREILVGW